MYLKDVKNRKLVLSIAAVMIVSTFVVSSALARFCVAPVSIKVSNVGVQNVIIRTGREGVALCQYYNVSAELSGYLTYEDQKMAGSEFTLKCKGAQSTHAFSYNESIHFTDIHFIVKTTFADGSYSEHERDGGVMGCWKVTREGIKELWSNPVSSAPPPTLGPDEVLIVVVPLEPVRLIVSAIDRTTLKSIGGAAVQVYNSTSRGLVASGTTNSTGYVGFSLMPYVYYLNVSGIGYLPYGSLNFALFTESTWTATLSQAGKLNQLSGAIFNAPARTVYFVRTGNMYDDSALGFVYAKCSNPPQNMIIQTDSTKVNQTTGAPLFTGNMVVFGGRAAGKTVKYYEDTGTARITYSGNATHHRFMKGSTVVYAVAISTYNYNKADYFVVQIYLDVWQREVPRTVLSMWGFAHTGTYASGVYFSDYIYPNLASQTQGYCICKWTDVNNDGIQQLDEIIALVSGS